MIIAGIIFVLFIIAGIYFIGLPIIIESSENRSTLQQVTTPSTQALTPFPTSPPTEISVTPTTADTPAVIQAYEERYMETYNQVYSVNHAFTGGQKEVFTQDLTTPPLFVKYNITPEFFSREKTVDVGLSSERVILLSYISPDSWFKVSVYDTNTRELVQEQGFNKKYSVMTQQEFMIRAPGNYRIEMTGNAVIAEVRILTGKS